MSNKCEICYDTNIDYCITQEELDKALEGMLSKDELRYYTTQEQVDLMIEAAQIQTENKVARNYYNKGEIDTIVEALPTKQWVRSQGYVNESDVKDIVDESIEAADINIDLSDYYTKAQVDQKIVDAVTGGDIDLEGYVTDTEMKDAIEEAINEIDLSEFVTEGELDTVVKDAVDSAISNIEIPNPDLTDYYTKQEVDNIVDGIDVDLTGYATETWVQGQGYLKTIPSDYVTESELNSAVEDAVSNIEIPVLVINTPHGLLCDDDGDGSYNTFENATYDGTKVGEIIDCILNNKPYKILAKQVYDDGSVWEFTPVEIWLNEGNREFETPRSIMVWFRMSANGSIIDYPGTLVESNNTSSEFKGYHITQNETYTSTKINQLFDEKIGDIDTILNNILYTV